MAKVIFTEEQKLEGVKRELKYRRAVYLRRVLAENMTQALADYQIALFEAIEADYEERAKKERLI